MNKYQNLVDKINNLMEEMESGPVLETNYLGTPFPNVSEFTTQALQIQDMADTAYTLLGDILLILEGLVTPGSSLMDKIKGRMSYRLTPAGRFIKWADWHRGGGCMPSVEVQQELKSKLDTPLFQWDMTLGELGDISSAFEKDIARFALEKFPALGMAEAYYILGDKS